LGTLDLAIVEAIKITPEGYLIPSYRLGDMPNFVQAAKHVIVQLNTYYPIALEGLHDVYIPQCPPCREVIPITSVDDRIGAPFITADPDRIVHIVASDLSETTGPREAVDDESRQIAKHLVSFLGEEVKRGRLPVNLSPIEVGLGRIPAAIMDELGQSEFEDLEFYSAILNDPLLDLIDQGKVKCATGSGLHLSRVAEEKLLRNLPLYKGHLVIRPVEITDCPEVIMRLGVLALNGAVEVDIYGHVNSSHVMNGNVISGVGGGSDFAMNAGLSVILLPSTAAKGNISTIVPMVTHVDIPEHGVDIVVTEQGLADLRGLTPKERAENMIERCAHASYRGLLRQYFEEAKERGGGHEPHLVEEAFSFHRRFLQSGSMRGTDRRNGGRS
jgi:succinyl-CoA:acetate CoA-transferase